MTLRVLVGTSEVPCRNTKSLIMIKTRNLPTRFSNWICSGRAV